jgi:hypothetical protein
MFERIKLMNKRALLLSGFLNENDIKDVQNNVSGNNMDFETLKKLLAKKNEKPTALGYTPGKPQIDFIEKKYAPLINEYYKKYKNNSFIPPAEWSFKSVEICPLLCNAVFLNLDKINYFQSMFNDNNYENVLHICLDMYQTEIKIKSENNGITLSCDNPNITGLVITPNLQILPQVNPSPVKIARINERYILIDGKHRAVALHKAGYEKIPAIVFNSASPYKIQSNYCFKISKLLDDAPPTIGHYMNKNFIFDVPLINNVNIFRIIIDKSTIQI